MEIRTTFKFEYEKDGETLVGIASDTLPEYATNVLETYQILHASKDMVIRKISTDEKRSSFQIAIGESLEDYEEVKREKRKPELPFEKEIDNADN
jgi:DNA-directed RNA polymerase subunit L